jgi:hypothetical protein
MLNIKDLSRPELPQQDNYEQALRIGLEIFQRKDPGRLAVKAGVRYENRRIIVPHLDRELVLDVKSRQFHFKETGEEAPIWLAILTLHYLNNADGRQPTGKLKHFREFKDGHFYEPAFNRRTKEILVSVFGDDPDAMIAAGERLKADILDTGDASVRLIYFPYIPITCILWRGDEEFLPEASVLFDESADLYFSAEDMAVAGQMAVLELLKAARE